MKEDTVVPSSVRIEVPASPGIETRLNRRTLLRGGAGMAGAAALLSRISFPASAQEASLAASPAATPDFIASGVEGVPDAYLKAPEPYVSYDGVPGSGGTVKAFVISYSPPPPARDDNQYWQELERRLGVTWDPILTPQPNYGEKSAALIAGGEWPDLFYLNPGQNASQQYQAMAQGAFLDLTPYVTGDALQQYPNLATFPQFMWDNVKFNGKIFGVPKPLWRNGNLPFFRQDWIDSLGLGVPATPDEIKALLVAFTNGDPDKNGSADTWGSGRFNSGWRNWDNELAFNMFNTPFNWRLNPDGTLTHEIETEEFRQAVDWQRQLYAEGGFHPDAAGMTFTDAQNAFIAGKTGLHYEGFLSFFGIGSVTYRIQETNPNGATVGIVTPGGNTRNVEGFFGYTGIPTAIGKDEDRVHELLRILDYLASPFGSEEANFLQYGIEGVHHTVDANGARIINDQGRSEKSDLPYLMAGLAVYYYPENPQLAIPIQNLAKQAAVVGIDDPTLGIYSEANVEKKPQLDQFGSDSMTPIITGRDDLSALDDAISGWKSRGGDDIRRQFEEALQSQ